MADLHRRAVAECLGTAFLAAAVVGSGIMAERLTGDVALALLANSIATGAVLVVLVTVLQPISGAHLNPAVSLVLVLRRQVPALDGVVYAIAQLIGGVLGVLAAHAMFDLPLLALSPHARTGPGHWLAEAIATCGLMLVVLVGARSARTAVPWLVGLYICSAYWFTASTSFANPALTLARALTDSFAGIRLTDTLGFLVAQLAGALFGAGVAALLEKNVNA